jgi:hypothetical protein
VYVVSDPSDASSAPVEAWASEPFIWKPPVVTASLD